MRPAWGRNVTRILGVEPRLDGVAARRDVEVERLPGGHAELQLDDVEARHSSVTGCSTWIRPFSSRK